MTHVIRDTDTRMEVDLIESSFGIVVVDALLSFRITDAMRFSDFDETRERIEEQTNANPHGTYIALAMHLARHGMPISNELNVEATRLQAIDDLRANDAE